MTNLSIKINPKLKEAIEKAIKDFKATLFIENIDYIEDTNIETFEINKIELGEATK